MKLIMLRAYGWMPCWRILFSTFSRCMSFHTAWVNRVVSSVREGLLLYPQLQTYCGVAANRREGAMCGRLRVGKEKLHVAGLVGAAMCSAYQCGSHDRWP